MDSHYWILLFVGIGIVLYILSNTTNKLAPIPNFLVIPLLLYVVYAIAFYPITMYSDKYMYQYVFNSIESVDISQAKDIGWAYYTYWVNVFFKNDQIYFVLNALIYLLGYYVFAKKFISSSYRFIFIYAVVMSFGFFAYGVNTLRAGLALSLVLIAFSQYKKLPLFLLFGIIGILFHKSSVLPLLAFIITAYFNKPKVLFVIWCGALLISFANISSVQSLLLSNLGSFDERGSTYLESNSKLIYKTGFRIDFVFYSVIPILMGLYYILKLKVTDTFYSHILSSYIVSNAIWLLVIRMNFTDRFAYLSWFLLPFLLLYPIVKYNLPINQKYLVSSILLGIMFFTILMQFL